MKDVKRGAADRSFVLSVLLALCVSAATVAGAIQPPRPATTAGTDPMLGPACDFGTTYTLDAGIPWNVTITGAEYRVERFVAGSRELPPSSGEKLLVIHFRVKNPNKGDAYFSGIPLTAVDANGKLHDGEKIFRREQEAENFRGVMLKPGQGLEDMSTAILVPARGPVPKLILNWGRRDVAGSKIVRFALGTGKNRVAPLPAPFADPADATGATARPDIPAEMAHVYPAARFDVELESVAYTPGLSDNNARPQAGKQYLVGKVRLTNRVGRPIYCSGSLLKVTVRDTDGEKADEQRVRWYLASRDEPMPGRAADPGEPITVRFVCPLPAGVKAKSVTLAEYVTNTNVTSHACTFTLPTNP